jgi:transposase
MLVNALRGHLAEFGLIEAQGQHKVAKLIAIVTDENDGRVPDIARQVLQVMVNRRYSCTDRWSREAGSRVAQKQPGQPTTGDHSWDRADHRHGHRSNGYRSQHIP